MRNIKIIVLFIAFSLIAQDFLAQENVRIRKKQFRIKTEGFKEAWKSVKSGNSDFSFSKATFRQARASYLKAYKYNEKNAELNYKIGVCYLFSDDKFQAIKYLKKSFELNKDVADDIHFQLARAYHMNLDFDNAIKEYRLYKSLVPERKLNRLNIHIDTFIAECETGRSLVSHPVRAVVQDLGKGVNSEYDDYYPVLDSKEETLYFTSRRPSKSNKQRNLNDQKYSEDIYISKRKGKDWSAAQLLSKRLTSSKSEAAVGLSPDNKKLYLFKSAGNGDIYYTEQKNGNWKSPSSFGRVNSGSRETSVSFSADGKKMYFVSDRDIKTSIGGKDIYFCELNAKGKWNKPQNIGGQINTADNEEAVSISKDGKTLYFSSKGHQGMGGYDIFSSTLNNGKWSKPTNLGYPINTPDDDMFFSAMDQGKIAYLSSNREQSIGERDLYRVIYLGVEKELSLAIENSPYAFELFDKKSMFVTKPALLDVDTSILVYGTIRDSETKKGIVAKVQFIDSEKAMVVATLITDTSGTYKAKLPERKSFGAEVSAKGYLFFLDLVDLKKETTDVVQKDFVLQGLEVGAKVVLKNIFFETGKATLKEESSQQLTTVIGFMKDNPTLKLEISGHTDNVGSLSSNLKLSELRAKAVVEYMVKAGIDQSRLTFKGYGPNQPVAPNTTKENKALNRRVEFKITGK